MCQKATEGNNYTQNLDTHYATTWRVWFGNMKIRYIAVLRGVKKYFLGDSQTWKNYFFAAGGFFEIFGRFGNCATHAWTQILKNHSLKNMVPRRSMKHGKILANNRTAENYYGTRWWKLSFWLRYMWVSLQLPSIPFSPEAYSKNHNKISNIVICSFGRIRQHIKFLIKFLIKSDQCFFTFH